MGFVFWGPVHERTLVGSSRTLVSAWVYCGGSSLINPLLPLFLSGSSASALSGPCFLGSLVVFFGLGGRRSIGMTPTCIIYKLRGSSSRFTVGLAPGGGVCSVRIEQAAVLEQNGEHRQPSDVSED